jgi:hypothetical protein
MNTHDASPDELLKKATKMQLVREVVRLRGELETPSMSRLEEEEARTAILRKRVAALEDDCDDLERSEQQRDRLLAAIVELRNVSAGRSCLVRPDRKHSLEGLYKLAEEITKEVEG